MVQFSRAQVMLSLALLSYRGFWESGDLSREGLAKTLGRGLEQLEPLAGDWHLIWGPGTYRHLGFLFDSSMMFVVRHRKRDGRYAIVVRGTNPLSIVDWIFGDFLPHRQVPWFGPGVGDDRGAAVSLSAALGLKSLLGMRAGNVPADVAEPGSFDGLVRLAARVLSGARGAGGAILSLAEGMREAPTVSTVLEDMQRLTDRFARYQDQWTDAMGFTQELAATVGALPGRTELIQLAALRKSLVALLDESVETMTETPLAVLMPRPEEMPEPQSGETTLLELLGHLATIHGNSLELFLTGHSKGGMLAPVLAMFLADTQAGGSTPAPEECLWNRNGRAAIHCYTFAGPTPGNTAFAQHFNDELGENFFRYANRLDATTLLWQSEKMRDMPGLLGEAAPHLPGMEILANQMADEVAGLDYAHLGVNYPLPGGLRNVVDKHVVEFSGRAPSRQSSWATEVIYQHLGAYIDLLGLDRFFDLQDLMGLVSAD